MGQEETTKQGTESPEKKTLGKSGTINLTINGVGALKEQFYEQAGNRTGKTYLKELLKIDRDFNEQTKVYENKIEALKEELNDLTNVLNERQNALEEARRQVEQLQTCNAEQQKEFAEYKAGNAKGLFVILEDLNKDVLLWVAEREKCTYAEVINRWIKRFFIEGSINGGLKTVPDSVIRRLKGGLEK